MLSASTSWSRRGAEQPAVDSHHLHTGSQSGFIAGHARNDVENLAVAAEGQAKRMLGRDRKPPRPGLLEGFGGLGAY